MPCSLVERHILPDTPAIPLNEGGEQMCQQVIATNVENSVP
jgi:hypothetical protein